MAKRVVKLGGVCAAEGHAQQAQELTSLVVGIGRRVDADVQADVALGTFDNDFGEDRVIRHTEGVVTLAIELGRDAAEVADGGSVTARRR